MYRHLASEAGNQALGAPQDVRHRAFRMRRTGLHSMGRVEKMRWLASASKETVMWQRRRWLAAAGAGWLGIGPVWGQAAAGTVGVVILHGKGGGPRGLVLPLAEALQARGMRVRNLAMPWSGRRHYDAGPESAQEQVARAIAELKREGAQRVFLVGHSQGGVFALHLAALLPLAGVVALAPGGNVASPVFETHLGSERRLARELVAAGRGSDVQTFADFEGSNGKNAVQARADVYWAWFDPQGVMNQERAIRAVPVNLPVLYVAPTGDFPALRRANPGLYSQLPSKALSRYAEPHASHTEAPTEAASLVGDWLMETAAR